MTGYSEQHVSGEQRPGSPPVGIILVTNSAFCYCIFQEEGAWSGKPQKKNTFTTLSKMKLEHDYRFLMSVLIIPDFFSFTVNLPALIWNLHTEEWRPVHTFKWNEPRDTDKSDLDERASFASFAQVSGNWHLSCFRRKLPTNQTSTNTSFSRPSSRFRRGNRFLSCFRRKLPTNQTTTSAERVLFAPFVQVPPGELVSFLFPLKDTDESDHDERVLFAPLAPAAHKGAKRFSVTLPVPQQPTECVRFYCWKSHNIAKYHV